MIALMTGIARKKPCALEQWMQLLLCPATPDHVQLVEPGRAGEQP